ncbi:MAG: dCTP deaminase [Bacteroidota bacterium]
MILTALEIQKERDLANITIHPFSIGNLGTISYKFSLGRYIIIVSKEQDSKQPSHRKPCMIPETGMLLQPDNVYLAATYERLGSIHFSQMIFGLKKIADSGIYIDISANLGHVGSLTNWTLELTVVKPVIVYPMHLIGQIVFWSLSGTYNKYHGIYNQKVLPMNSMGLF